MKRNGLYIGCAALWLASLLSCGQHDVYNEFNTLPKNGWFKRDVQRFTPESPDSTGRYDLFLTLRHNGDYAYRNLWLFVSYEFGRWSGGGWGSYYQQELLLDDCFRFGSDQVVTIQQAMRDDRIRGISDIGIRIAPHKP